MPWDQVEDYMHLQSSVDMDALDSENWYEDVENENAGLSQVDNPAQTRRNGGKSGKKSESFPTAAAMQRRKNCRRSLNVLSDR